MRVPLRARGVALILALLVLVLLAVVIGQMAYTTRIDSTIAQNSSDGQEALHAAWGATEFAKGLLRDDVQRNDHDGMSDRWARITQAVKIGEHDVKLTIVDEERKLNLLLLASEHEPFALWAEATLTRLVERAREGSEEENELPAAQIAEHIVAWFKEGRVPGVSSDDQQFTETGESSEIPAMTMAELLAIEGVTTRVLYGPPPPPRGDPDADEESDFDTEPIDPGRPNTLDELLGEAPKKVRGIADFVTLWTEGRINANTVDPLLLRSMSEYIDDETVERVVQARTSADGGDAGGEGEGGGSSSSGEEETTTDNAFTATSDMREVEGMDAAGEETPWKDISPYLTVGSQVFQIQAVALVGRTERTVTLVVKREAKGFRVLWYQER